MVFVRITPQNLPETGLDGFIRTQVVARSYRRGDDGEYRLAETPFTDDWTPSRKREKARELTSANRIAFGAFENDRLVGFSCLLRATKGSRAILDSMHVSKDFRGRGIGRRLFFMAAKAAREMGAEEMMISACPSEETIAFYRAMGAKVTDNPIPEMAEEEPFDLQMSLSLRQTDFLNEEKP